MKHPLSIAVVALAAALRRAGAHPLDDIGTPDPYWQDLARAAGNGQIATDGAGAVAGAAHPWLLRGYLFGVIALFAAFGGALVYSFWASGRGSEPGSDS